MNIMEISKLTGSITKYPLAGAVAIVLYGAAGFYFFERDSWPDLTFGDSLWWSLVTAMTVGYGDVYPKTWQGRWIVAAPTILLGVGFLAHTFGVASQGQGPQQKLTYAWQKPKSQQLTGYSAPKIYV